MKKLDSKNGLEQDFHYDPATGNSTVHTYQDVEPYLEIAKAARNSDYSKEGIKQDWWHLAFIPDVIILKMWNEDGVNIYDQNDWPKLGELLEGKYAYFKMTDGHHKLKG